MKHKPLVKHLIVLVTIVAFSSAAFSFPGKKKEEEEKEKYGQLEVISAAKKAVVFIEGFNMGPTPLKLENMKPGIYRIIVKAPAHNDFVEDVTVEKQELSKVDARMIEGGEGTKLPLCDYGSWDSLSKQEKSRLERATYSSFLLAYKNIEVANFDLKIKSKKSLPRHLLFPFYYDMIRQLDKYTDFAQIVAGYTGIRGMEELKKVCTPEQAAPGEKTLLLSGVVKKLKKGKSINPEPEQSSQDFQVSRNVSVSISTSATPAPIKLSPKIAILFRLTGKENGYVVYSRLISGSIYTVGEDFAKALKEAVDTLRERE